MVIEGHKLLKINLIVLEDSSYSSLGGGQVVTSAIIDKLQYKYSIHLFDFDNKSKFSTICSKFNIKISYLKGGLYRKLNSKNASSRLPMIKNLCYIFIFQINIIKIIAYIKRNKLDNVILIFY